MGEGESPGILETNLRPVDVSASGVIEEVALHRSEPSESTRWWPSLLVRLGGIGLAGAGVWMTRATLEPVVALVLLFAILVPLEKLFPRRPDQRIRREGLSLDVGYALAAPVLGILASMAGILVGVISLAWLPGLAFRGIVAQIPDRWEPFVGLLVFDFIAYWAHRFMHEAPSLWRIHAIHHSPEEMDWVSGFRGHPFDGIIAVPAIFFMLAAGFEPEITGALAALQLLLGLFFHANVRLRLRPLRFIVATPDFHHWHHASEEDAIWTNYGSFLPIWDLMFGTYYVPVDRMPVTYGVDEEIPGSMLGQLRYPFEGMSSPWWIVRHPMRSLRSAMTYLRRLLGELRFSIRRPRDRGQALIDQLPDLD